MCKKAGRLNKINESLLYTSPHDPTVPLKKLQIKDGEFYVLIIYQALTEIKINLIGGNYNYASMGILDKHIILINQNFE